MRGGLGGEEVSWEKFARGRLGLIRVEAVESGYLDPKPITGMHVREQTRRSPLRPRSIMPTLQSCQQAKQSKFPCQLELIDRNVLIALT